MLVVLNPKESKDPGVAELLLELLPPDEELPAEAELSSDDTLLSDDAASSSLQAENNAGSSSKTNKTVKIFRITPPESGKPVTIIDNNGY